MKKRKPPEVSAPELQSGLGYFRGSSYCKYTTNFTPIMRSSRQVFEGGQAGGACLQQDIYCLGSVG